MLKPSGAHRGTEFSCPACGDNCLDPSVEPVLLSPGSFEWACPLCETQFLIRIEFETLGEPTAQPDDRSEPRPEMLQMPDRKARSIFPISAPHTLKEQVLIDGAWHQLAYVFAGGLPLLFVDGKPASVRGEIAWFERALSDGEIATFEATSPDLPKPPTVPPHKNAN